MASAPARAGNSLQLRFTILTKASSKGLCENSQKYRDFRDRVLRAIGSQNKCHTRVYLDDADDFIFGCTKKYLQAKKLRPIKDAPLRARSDIHPDHRRKLREL